VRKVIVSIALIVIVGVARAQEQEFSTNPSISLLTGIMNYQGDLNPNSFTFNHSHFTAGLIIRKPLNRWFTLRTGAVIGSIEAADRYNRDYLKPRNLSFHSSIQDVHLGVEITLLNIATKRFTPYLYAGIAVFHFNPWTYDNTGKKTYLQPLSTEGQGLPEYPEQKSYKLTQFSFPFGGGIKIMVSDDINIGVEFSQRKSFTDYIDDVSTYYADRDILLSARGAKAVELAYRGNEIPGGLPYPHQGEQRGTASEMDWYYYAGTTIEIKFSSLGQLFGNKRSGKSSHMGCPRNISSY
jgi:opacity protein-like surface antigen